MSNASYADAYRGIDFRERPELYKIGKGEQGVLMAEPYKSEILPNWRFLNPEIAEESAKLIYAQFEAYLMQDDFVGADMARKFLQMGFTRARRYANHASGHKYNVAHVAKPQDAGSESSDKATAARIFKTYYDRARTHEQYQALKDSHLTRQKSHSTKAD